LPRADARRPRQVRNFEEMHIIGISAFYHDSAACLVRDGDIVAAAQEERFTRKKHDPDFPHQAVAYCLREGKVSLAAVDYVVFYEKPLIKFERILETQLAYAPAGLRSFLRSTPLWLKEKLWMSELIKKKLQDFRGELLFPQHHESHAASAFYPSPFEEAAFLTIDGAGEWTTTSWGTGSGNQLEIHHELQFPHSLGLLYSAFTYYTGFKVNSGEYKVMGLAPYGQPRYANLIYEHLLDLRSDGSFKLNMDYFNYCAGLTMTGERFHALFGGEPRKPESPLTQREMDLAASVQKVTEDVMLAMARHIRKETGQKYLCLAGGVALNCVANGKILREGIFDDLWIQPAAGDAGGSLGAALFAWHQVLDGKRTIVGSGDRQQGSYLGPCFSDEDVEAFLRSQGIPFEKLAAAQLPSRVADLLADEKVIGWFQGRMEFGPRALGARSIIGDARLPAMQAQMNLKIKFRESFRPFAPSVLAEKVSDYFDIDRASPYMLLVADVKKDKQRRMTADEERLWGIDKLNIQRSVIPAVTHVDYSARIQTVHKETNPLYHALIEEFDRKTGCPVIVNTSFNVRGEPIVCTPADAYRCFMRTHMDYLVLGTYILDKANQPEWKDDTDWRREYELD
jgi:carbamoyltransferase